MPEDIQQLIIKEFGSEVTQKAYKQWAEEGFWEAEKVLINKYFKKGSSVLDIGCGTGRTTIPFFQMGYEVEGVDITPEMIFNAKEIASKKNLAIVYKVEDATNLQYTDNSFDNAIFSNNGWTQIPGKEKRFKALCETYRVLKPSGYFIFTTHERMWKGYFWFWLKQLTKIYVLKPIGLKIGEIDFGDRFFARETSGAVFEQKQFIHIPNVLDVRKQIIKAGFELVLMQRENEIVEKDLHDNDNVFNHAPMFYVCKK